MWSVRPPTNKFYEKVGFYFKLMFCEFIYSIISLGGEPYELKCGTMEKRRKNRRGRPELSFPHNFLFLFSLQISEFLINWTLFYFNKKLVSNVSKFSRYCSSFVWLSSFGVCTFVQQKMSHSYTLVNTLVFGRKGGDMGLLISQSSQSFIITFYIRWLDNFGNLNWIMFDWLVH